MYKVYVVEDDPIILDEIINDILFKDNGFEVVGYSTSPKKAVEEIKSLNPHVVFSDLKMPGIDGIELFEEISKNGIECEFVIISAFASFEDSRRFFRIKGFDYILKPLQHDEVQILLEKLSAKLSKTIIPEQSSTEEINPAFAELVMYIRDNFKQKHTLDLLSAKFNLSPNYICNLFTKYYNTTLTRYLTQIRMNHALHIMKTTKKAYKEIAIDCGYTDYYYFCKVFKMFFGKSPSNYLDKK